MMDLYLSKSKWSISSLTLFLLYLDDTKSELLFLWSRYIFFVTLLSIPESSFSVVFKMFDADNNGYIEPVVFAFFSFFVSTC